MAASEIVTTPGHVFYERLNTVLNAEKFDRRVESVCRKYYKKQFEPPQPDAGNVLPAAAVGLLRGHRFGARHRVACGRQLQLPQVPGLRSERANAGSFDGVADPAVVLG